MINLNLSLQAGKTGVCFALPVTAPLAWASFGIETAALWFFGRGAYRLEIRRDNTAPQPDTGDSLIWFHIVPLDEPGSLQFSNITTVDSLRTARLFPTRLVEPWDVKNGETLVNLEGYKRDVTMGFIAYGLADVTVDLFRRGATNVWAQYSHAMSQVKCNVPLDERQVNDLLDPDTWDYEPSQTLEVLSWKLPSNI